MSVQIPWVGVVVATLVGFLTSFLYFNEKTLFPAWWRAMGKEGQQPGSGGIPMGALFGSALVSVAAQALVLGYLAAKCAEIGGDLSLVAGAGLGLLVGIIVIGASLGHRLFGGHGFRVWFIESGADLLGVVLMGIVLSFWV